MKVYEQGTQVFIEYDESVDILSSPTRDTSMVLKLGSVAFKIDGGTEVAEAPYVKIKYSNGNLVGDKQEVIDYLATFISKQEVDLAAGAEINVTKNQLGYDAWGRLKASKDVSLLHGMFTFNVPVTMWYEKIDGIEQTAITRTQSIDGELYFTPGATLNDETELRSFRNPRYQPNRGHLYSTAGFFDNPDALQIREFGIFTKDAGVFFRLTGFGFAHLLQGVVRTTRGGVVIEDTTLIDTTGIDISKGNTFDIQFQWRGVGSDFFFINLTKTGSFDYLGTLTSVSMFNPALPPAFRSVNLGGNEPMRFGCVDVTSEGGDANGNTYGSISISNESGQVDMTGFNTPCMVVRSKKLIGNLENTRDTLALLLSAYSDQRSFIRVWITRDFTAITDNDQVWKDFGDGHLEYLEYDNPNVATPMTFDTTKAVNVFGSRVNQDETYATSALFEGRTDIYLTPGDMFVFTMHRENGTGFLGGTTFEFGEAI